MRVLSILALCWATGLLTAALAECGRAIITGTIQPLKGICGLLALTLPAIIWLVYFPRVG